MPIHKTVPFCFILRLSVAWLLHYLVQCPLSLINHLPRDCAAVWYSRLSIVLVSFPLAFQIPGIVIFSLSIKASWGFSLRLFRELLGWHPILLKRTSIGAHRVTYTQSYIPRHKSDIHMEQPTHHTMEPEGTYIRKDHTYGETIHAKLSTHELTNKRSDIHMKRSA